MSAEQSEFSLHKTKNESKFLISGAFVVLANRLASPQVVLPWVFNLIGGPTSLVGFLVPSVRLGGLLTQLTIIPTLLSLTYRKWTYVVASFLIAATLLLIYLTVLEFSLVAAVSVFFVCTLVLGACNGVIMLSSQDVMAKSITPKRIGQLLARQASIGGVLTIILLITLYHVYPDNESQSQHLVLIVLAAVAMVAAGLVFAMIREPPSTIRAKRSVWVETRHGWSMFRTTPWFRHFFMVRSLFLSVGLATPFYSIHVASEHGAEVQTLSIFVLATGTANMLSVFVWSKLLSKNPTRVFVWSGRLAAAAGAVAMLEQAFASLPNVVMYVFVFAFLELAVQGLSQASRTYLALMAPEVDRPQLLAINNALLGVMAIVISIFIGLIAHTTHIYGALGFLMAMALLASYSSWSLKRPVIHESA